MIAIMLIIVMTPGAVSVTTAEYASISACVAAGRLIDAQVVDRPAVVTICTTKGAPE